MSTLTWMAFSFAATLSLHNCGNSKTTVNNKTENVVSIADSSRLFKYIFYASELKGKAVPEDVKAWISFNIEKVSGNTGCNSTTGSYELKGDGIAFKQMATTRRACLGNNDEVERNFMAVISEANKWKLTDTHLILSNGTAELGKFKAIPPPKE